MTKVALAVLRGLYFGMLKTGKYLRPVGRVLVFIFSLIGKYLLFPIYAFIVLFRIRMERLLVGARGFFFLIFTNRYIFHATLIAISIVTIGSQLQTKSATAYDTGRGTMLYALVTQGQSDVVEEEVKANVKNANYLGDTTIQALPGIDYDYDEDQPMADTSVPGSIAALPGSNEPGIPGSDPIVVRTKTETYTIQSGDTVASIAQRFGVNAGTVIWANKLDSRAFIKPGESLKIPAVSGVLYTIKKGDTLQKVATLYKLDVAAISDANHLTDTTLSVGEELILPGASPLPVAVAPKPSTSKSKVNPSITISRIPGKEIDKYQELTKTADTRQKPPDESPDVSAAKLLWPTRQHAINQYYGWKHTGIDFNGDYTDAIYASEDGVVEQAGWNSGGYGLMVLINHQNGYKTRYGHASKLFVATGDTVKRGQVIGMVGTTGRSTGTHLHYEVYINGKRVNPLVYIK
ncbi:MAG: M23 family metallopeptidase [bacterium]|nr:M23 family metallopeptidase [bacterium]